MVFTLAPRIHYHIINRIKSRCNYVRFDGFVPSSSERQSVSVCCLSLTQLQSDNSDTMLHISYAEVISMSGEAALHLQHTRNTKYTIHNTKHKTQNKKCSIYVPIVLYPVRSRSCVTEYIWFLCWKRSTLLQRQAKRNRNRYRTANLTFLTGLFLLIIDYLSYLLLILSRAIEIERKEVRVSG